MNGGFHCKRESFQPFLFAQAKCMSEENRERKKRREKPDLNAAHRCRCVCAGECFDWLYCCCIIKIARNLLHFANCCMHRIELALADAFTRPPYTECIAFAYVKHKRETRQLTNNCHSRQPFSALLRQRGDDGSGGGDVFFPCVVVGYSSMDSPISMRVQPCICPSIATDFFVVHWKWRREGTETTTT